MPVNDRSSVIVLGKSNCGIGLILSGSGRTPEAVMMRPNQGASDLHQWHFDASIEKSCCSNRWRTASTVKMWVLQLVKNIPTSLTHTSTLGTSENNSSIAVWDCDGELRKPMGDCRCLHLQKGVAITHFSCESLSSKKVWNCINALRMVACLKLHL